MSAKSNDVNNPIYQLNNDYDKIMSLLNDTSYKPCEGYYCNSSRIVEDAITFVFLSKFDAQKKCDLIKKILEHSNFDPNYLKSSYPMISKCFKLEPDESVRRYFFSLITQNEEYDYFASNKHGVNDSHVCMYSKITDEEKELYLSVIIGKMNRINIPDNENCDLICYCIDTRHFKNNNIKRNIIDLIINHPTYRYNSAEIVYDVGSGDYISILQYCKLHSENNKYLSNKIEQHMRLQNN